MRGHQYPRMSGELVGSQRTCLFGAGEDILRKADAEMDRAYLRKVI